MGWFDFTTGVTPNVQIDGTLTVGSDGVGHDVTFYGDTSGAYLLWDADTDKLILTGGSQIYINSQTLQALRAEYNITTQQGAWVHGVKVELTRAADIQPSTGAWFGGQFVLNAGSSGYTALDKPAYALQAIFKGSDTSPNGQDIHVGRFEVQSAGKVSDIVHILANTGTTVVGSLEYIAAHVAPGVAMLNINAQSSITVPTGVKIMSGTGSSYNYGIDLASATINTADIRFHHSATLLDDGTDLTLAGSNLALAGKSLKLDADGDSDIHADTDDEIDFKIGGSNEMLLVATTLRPATTGGLDLGSSAKKWKDIYLSGDATIGGTLGVTGAVTLSSTLALGGVIDMNSHQINELTDPSSAQDAATKNYVDVSAGGLYGINVESLTDDKTLTAGTDEIYQYLAPNGTYRFISLDAGSATAGDRFVIRNTDAYNSIYQLAVKISGTNEDEIWAGDVREYIFNGTTWVAATTGVGEAGTGDGNVGIGVNANARVRGVAIGAVSKGHDYGAALGYTAQGQTCGVAVGGTASGYSYGVAIGYDADGHSYGIAVGYSTDTNSKKYSIALGHYAETERTGETSIAIDGTSDQENNVVQGRWALETANATPAEMFCGGEASERFTVRASSALAFTMKIVARDNVAGEVAMYTFEGLIKRDAANNTTLSVVNKAIIHEDDATWDVTVTADDTNEALIITVTGDADNATQWAAVMDGVETHF